MRLSHFILTRILVSAMLVRIPDEHPLYANAQNIVGAVNTKYPAVANTLVFIVALEGYIARFLTMLPLKRMLIQPKERQLSVRLHFKSL